MDDQGIQDMFGEAFADEPPIVGGPGAVFAGAAKVRNRQWTVGGISAVAVLGIAAGAVALTGGGGPHSTSVTAGASTGSGPATATSAPATSAPATPTTNAAPAADQVALDEWSTVEIVKQLVPAGMTTSDYLGQGSVPGSMVSIFGALSVDDGKGASQIQITVQNANFGADAVNPCSNMGSACRVEHPSAGSTMYLYTGPGDKIGSGPGGPVVAYTVDLHRADGVRVVLEMVNYVDPFVTNAPSGGTRNTTTRAEPALTLDQLGQIATSPEWALTVPSAFEAQAKADLKPFQDTPGS
jgi:hypothetical protein